MALIWCHHQCRLTVLYVCVCVCARVCVYVCVGNTKSISLNFIFTQWVQLFNTNNANSADNNNIMIILIGVLRGIVIVITVIIITSALAFKSAPALIRISTKAGWPFHEATINAVYPSYSTLKHTHTHTHAHTYAHTRIYTYVYVHNHKIKLSRSVCGWLEWSIHTDAPATNTRTHTHTHTYMIFIIDFGSDFNKYLHDHCRAIGRRSGKSNHCHIVLCMCMCQCMCAGDRMCVCICQRTIEETQTYTQRVKE